MVSRKKARANPATDLDKYSNIGLAPFFLPGENLLLVAFDTSNPPHVLGMLLTRSPEGSVYDVQRSGIRAEAPHGLGPRLYQASMLVLARDRDGRLAPDDPNLISKEAESVWAEFKRRGWKDGSLSKSYSYRGDAKTTSALNRALKRGANAIRGMKDPRDTLWDAAMDTYGAAQQAAGSRRRAARLRSEARANPEPLYHVTFSGRLESIAENGLAPGRQRSIGTAQYDQHRSGVIFVSEKEGAGHWFHTSEQFAYDASDDILGDGFVPVVLRIDSSAFGPDLELCEADEIGGKEHSGESYKCSSSVDPESIEVWTGRKWVPVENWPDVDLESAFEEDSDGDETWLMLLPGYKNPLMPTLKRNPGRKKKANPRPTAALVRRWERYRARAGEQRNLKSLGALAAKGRKAFGADDQMVYMFELSVADRAKAFGVKCDTSRADRVKRCVDGLIEGQQTTMFENPAKRTPKKKRKLSPNLRKMPDPGASAWLGSLLEWKWKGKKGDVLWEPDEPMLFLWSTTLKAVIAVPHPDRSDMKRKPKISRQDGGAKMAERFLARPAAGTYGIQIPNVPLVKLGPATHIVYRSDKWNPTEEIDYIHDFGPGVNLYCGPTLRNPKVFLCFGGRLTCTERGLVY